MEIPSSFLFLSISLNCGILVNDKYFFSTLWIILPHILGFTVLIIILILLLFQLRKKRKLNNCIIEYINTVKQLKKAAFLLSDNLNEISNSENLDDQLKDKIRVSLWRINNMQLSIKDLDSTCKNSEWIKNSELFSEDPEKETNNNDHPEIDKNTNGENKQSGFKDEQFIEKVFSIIRENYSNQDFNVDILSYKMSMSRSSFYNRIKQITGQAPADFIREYRMERAKELLKTEEYSISEVAYRCGFSDVKYFRDSFKKKYAKSPGKYFK
jgi:AraC-like DNA-binding protein